jgi:RNA polymerase-binding protein DksA
MNDYTAIEAKLKELRHEMTTRRAAIEKDVHHRDEPVEKDFAEQATQRENEEVLNALDDEARFTIQQIDNALLRIKDGTYGICQGCGNAIAEKRLEAIPFATMCINCAE